jgi:hypothetical protein
VPTSWKINPAQNQQTPDTQWWTPTNGQNIRVELIEDPIEIRF